MKFGKIILVPTFSTSNSWEGEWLSICGTFLFFFFPNSVWLTLLFRGDLLDFYYVEWVYCKSSESMAVSEQRPQFSRYLIAQVVLCIHFLSCFLGIFSIFSLRDLYLRMVMYRQTSKLTQRSCFCNAFQARQKRGMAGEGNLEEVPAILKTEVKK